MLFVEEQAKTIAAPAVIAKETVLMQVNECANVNVHQFQVRHFQPTPIFFHPLSIFQSSVILFSSLFPPRSFLPLLLNTIIIIFLRIPSGKGILCNV